MDMGARFTGLGTEMNMKTCDVERAHTCLAMPRPTQKNTGGKTNCRTKQRLAGLDLLSFRNPGFWTKYALLCYALLLAVPRR